MGKADRMETKDLNPITREFLFTLAYWVATADHVLQDAERKWFDAQFGDSFATDLMERLSAMQPSCLKTHVRQLYRQVPPDALPGIKANIRTWLRDLVFADEERAMNETVVVGMVLGLLGMRTHRKRRVSLLRDLKPFKGWPNPVAGISRSSFEIH